MADAKLHLAEQELVAAQDATSQQVVRSYKRAGDQPCGVRRSDGAESGSAYSLRRCAALIPSGRWHLYQM